VEHLTATHSEASQIKAFHGQTQVHFAAVGDKEKKSFITSTTDKVADSSAALSVAVVEADAKSDFVGRATGERKRPFAVPLRYLQVRCYSYQVQS